MNLKFIYFTKKRLIVHAIILFTTILCIIADNFLCSYYLFCEVIENIYALIILEFVNIFPKIYLIVLFGLIIIEVVHHLYYSRVPNPKQ